MGKMERGESFVIIHCKDFIWENLLTTYISHTISRETNEALRIYNPIPERAPNWLNLRKLIYFRKPPSATKVPVVGIKLSTEQCAVDLVKCFYQPSHRNRQREAQAVTKSSFQYLRLTLPSVTINPREQTKAEK